MATPEETEAKIVENKKLPIGEATLLNNIGLIYNKKGELDLAEKNFRNALKIDDKIGNIKGKATHLYNISGVFIKQEKYDKALNDFNKAIELDAEITSAFFFRGVIYNEWEQYDKAISDFNKALQINPKFTKVYNNRGIAYKLKGQYDKAVKDYYKALESNPDLMHHSMHCSKVGLIAMGGPRGVAESRFQLMIAVHPFVRRILNASSKSLLGC